MARKGMDQSSSENVEIAVRLHSNKEKSYIGKKGPGARWRQKHTDLKK